MPAPVPFVVRFAVSGGVLPRPCRRAFAADTRAPQGVAAVFCEVLERPLVSALATLTNVFGEGFHKLTFGFSIPYFSNSLTCAQTSNTSTGIRVFRERTSSR